MTELYPFLAVRDVARAVEYYAEAFGATEEGERLTAPDGRQISVLLIDGRHVGVATEAPELGTPSAARCSRSPTSRTGCGKAASSTRSGTIG